MGKLLFAVVAALASFVWVESLICNKCSFSVLGTCIGRENMTCGVNTSVCFTSRTTFPGLSNFVGFNSQGCQDNRTGCDGTTTGTLLSARYETKTTCCTADNCNPITLNGAPSTKTTLSAAISAALLASVLGSIL